MSIGRALNCRRRIQQYVAEYDIGNCDVLSRHDWKVLEKVHSSLHCYYEATLCCQGNNHSLGRWFSTLDFLFSRSHGALCEFRDLKEQNPESEEYVWLEAAADGAWQKCQQYYKLADNSAAYYAAEVLQPGRKWSWLNEQWGSDPQKRIWLKKTEEAVQRLWEEEYKGKFATPSNPQPRDRNPDDEFGGLSEHREIKNLPVRSTNDAYLSYIDRDLETGEDLLDYWNSRLLSRPDLARFALDMLAIPATSAECERVFSSAKLLVTASRNRLLPDVIEANECLRNWFGKPKKVMSMSQDQDRARSAISITGSETGDLDSEGRSDENEEGASDIDDSEDTSNDSDESDLELGE
jgi:hAT family C-terminal dimerisation region